MQILLEADYITTNLSNLVTQTASSDSNGSDASGNAVGGEYTVDSKWPTNITTDLTKIGKATAKAANDAEKDTPEEGSDETSTEKPASTSDNKPKEFSAEEFNRRIEENEKADPAARRKRVDIIDEFWTEYFSTFADEATTNKLRNFKHLHEDILKYGFNVMSNPFLAFVQQEYVQNNLIDLGLLNNYTYKVISQAAKNKVIPYGVLMKTSDYNIIYCRDLYTKDDDILKYLKAQGKTLPANATMYSTEMQKRNKYVMIEGEGNISTLTPSAKLRELDDIQAILGVDVTSSEKDKNEKSKNDGSESSKKADSSGNTANENDIDNFIIENDLDSDSTKRDAVLLYLYNTFGGEEIDGNTFSDTSIQDAFIALKSLRGALKGLKLNTKTAKYFIQELKDYI